MIRMVLDPHPDWTLEELKVELNALEQRLNGSTLRHLDRSLPTSSSIISWRAPLATTDFGRTSGPFIMRAFDDESEEENDFSDEDGTAASEECTEDLTTRPQEDNKSVNLVCRELEFGMAGGLLLPKTDVTDATLFELERERLHRVKEDLRQRRTSLETSLMEEIDKSLVRLTQVKKDEEQKFEIARRRDKQYQRSIAEARDYFMSEMQRDHEQRSQVEERKIRKDAAAQEARRREIALREAHERELKAQFEAEAKVKADLILQTEKRKLAAEADRKQHAEAAASAALRRTEEERKLKLEEAQCKKDPISSKAALVSRVESSTDISSTGPKPRVAETAAKLETERFQKLQSLQESTKLLQSSPALTKGLKSLERLTIKILQQVSATQEQVRKKSFELTALLSDSSKPQQFLMLTLASKLLSQCESQILKLPSFAFPLAQVVVNVAAQIPYLMDVVLAKLNAACIFTVPKYFIFSKGQFEDDISYYKTLGYQVGGDKLESTDEYLSRMIAYMNFYAAITQTEASAGTNPYGLKEAWIWCARLLNKVPANRYSASALEAVLKIAGFRLYQVYPKPFTRLMQSIMNEFLVNLKKQSDPDLRAVINRLETYFQTQQFRIEPEGREMPPTDLSSSMRA